MAIVYVYVRSLFASVLIDTDGHPFGCLVVANDSEEVAKVLERR